MLSTARRSNAPTSTSHRFDSELNRLAAEMDCKGGETVQACFAYRPMHCCTSYCCTSYRKTVTINT